MGIDQNWMRQHVQAGGSFGRKEFFALCDELEMQKAALAELVTAANGLLDVTGRGKVCTVTESLAAYHRVENALLAARGMS